MSDYEPGMVAGIILGAIVIMVAEWLYLWWQKKRGRR